MAKSKKRPLEGQASPLLPEEAKKKMATARPAQVPAQKGKGGGGGGQISPNSSVQAGDGRLARVLEDDALLNALLDSIPDHLTLPAADEANQLAVASRFEKNKKGEAPQQSRKEQSAKNKRARYDPQRVAETTLDKQRTAAYMGKQQQPREKMAVDSDESKEGKMADSKKTPVKKKGEDRRAESLGSAALREKVREIIEAKRRGREVKKGSHRDNRNRAKASRGGAAAAPLPATKKDKKVPSAAPRKKPEGIVTPALVAAVSAVTQPASVDLPVISSLGGPAEKSDLSFGGLRVGAAPKELKVGKSGAKMSRLHSLLRAAEKKSARYEELRKTQEGREVLRDQEMTDAIKSAENLGKATSLSIGQARKAIKKKEKAKAKSAQKWEEREKKVKDAKGARQAKREANLQERQRRPGFEGKKEDFLNSSGGGGAGGNDAITTGKQEKKGRNKEAALAARAAARQGTASAK